MQEQNLAFLARLNREHLARHPGESDLEARIASYELAARMQTAAKEALDLSGESEATKKLYGLDDPVTREYGTRCLIARRLVERGVRFVQLFVNGQIWDTHESITKQPRQLLPQDRPAFRRAGEGPQGARLARHHDRPLGRRDRPAAGHRKPRRRREGRARSQRPGLQHWLAGGGFKGGMTYGETDEFGHKAVVNPVSPNDYHATLLHLFGLDHTKLVYHHNGQEERITDTKPCRVVKEILRNA